MTSEVDDPLALLGAWSLDRVIEDRVAAERTRLDGRLVLARTDDGGVSWEERATWHRPDGPVDVRRALRLAEGAQGWWVHFDDGREFHPWLPGEAVVHACGADTYCGTVTGSRESWQVTWEVSGPQKDYTMTTVLRPLDATTPP